MKYRVQLYTHIVAAIYTLYTVHVHACMHR